MSHGPLVSVLGYLRRRVSAGPEAERSDGHLLEQFATRRDESAFGTLVERHGPMVLSVCRRILDDVHDAEDAFQATFLVLARKAASIRKHASVAAWLHGVALRVARKMRAALSRRSEEPGEVETVAPEDPVAAAVLRELRPLLDEELGRLPENYRVALVLCYLEGKTGDEAAEQLGWPRGTVFGRLARARDLLRDRLARRGLGLSIAALTAALTAGVAEASVPTALVPPTVQAALSFATAGAAATASPVTALAEGVIQAMYTAKLKFTAIVLLTLATLGTGVGFVAQKAFAAGSEADPAVARPDDEMERLKREIDQLRKKLIEVLEDNRRLRDEIAQLKRLTDDKTREAQVERERAEAARAQAEAQLRKALADYERALALEKLGKAPDDKKPADADPRIRAAKQQQSQNNLKQIGIAFHNYLDQTERFPAHAIHSKDGKPLLSWRVAILPYIEQDALYKQFKLDEPWDSDHNKKLIAQMPKTYAAPGMKPGTETFYRVFTGRNTAFPGRQGARITDITDGTSNTVLVVEAGDSVPWTKPDDLPLGKDLPKLGGILGDRFNVLIADGSVRSIGTKFDEEMFRNILDPSDGQPIDFNKLEK